MAVLIPEHCELCPRRCGADRRTQTGRCGAGNTLRAARAALHRWEEPCISGEDPERGSGTVFFCGCTLGCVFCQNGVISHGGEGKKITAERLAEVFLALQAQGAYNINLVTPTQYLPWILEALNLCGERLAIPVLYNTGGYERVEMLRLLEGRVQIYLPDLADFARMNEVWEAWVVPGHTPARATVQAALANPHWKIEVVITAAV